MEANGKQVRPVGEEGLVSEADCSLDDFDRIVSTLIDEETIPNATEVDHGVPVYDSALLSKVALDQERNTALASEIANILASGPGVIVFRQAVPRSILDRTTTVFFELIESERVVGKAAGDHFAKPGVNDRVWNALEKLGRREPGVFAEYYQCHALAFASLAWLGPHYQVTSQLNVVNPGGQSQQPHRDYHLGFMTTQKPSDFQFTPTLPPLP